MSICKSTLGELNDSNLDVFDNNEIHNSDNDMWSLIRPELRSVSDAFVSLLSSNARSTNNDKYQWEKKQPSRAYAPYSRNSSDNRFQLCTEGLGCESCDGLTDSDDSSSSFSSSPPINKGSDILAEEEDDIEDGGDPPIRNAGDFPAEEDDNYIENGEETIRKEINGTKNVPPTARKFPPPLPSISRNNPSSVFMRSFKKDGRFVLQAVKVPSSNYLQTFREGGRLKMQLIRGDDDVPENRAPERYVETDSDDEIDDDDDKEDDVCSEPESSDCDDLVVGKPRGEELAPVNDVRTEFWRLEFFVPTLEYSAVRNYLGVANTGFVFNCDGNNTDDGWVSSKRRSGRDETRVGAADHLTEMKSADVSVKSRVKARAGSGLSAYHGWRSSLHLISGFCQGSQALQKSPSPSVCVLNYPLNRLPDVQRQSVIDCRSPSLPRHRLKESGYGRCQETKASPAWVTHCVATSS